MTAGTKGFHISTLSFCEMEFFGGLDEIGVGGGMGCAAAHHC